MKRHYEIRGVWFTTLLAAMVLSACGGDGDSAPSPPASGTPPSSSNPGPDTTAPTVSASVSVASDIVTFLATTTDNVGVASVTFLLDGGALQGTVQKSPSDGSYSLQTPTNLIGAGNHTLSATATDAAGNTATSAVVSFTVGSQPSDGPDTTPPTVTAAVDGNFGLVKLTAIATDDRRVDSVSFMIDGAPLTTSATAAYHSTDPDNQFFKRFDTKGLADGPHIMVARARDRAFNQTDSTAVTFIVDSTAGLIETDPNDTIATATPVMRSQLQIAGTLNTVKTVLDDIILLRPDNDYYRITLAPGENISINMLSTQGFFLSVVDANQAKLSSDRVLISSDVSNVTYTNGPMSQDVYISVTNGPAEFPENQYRLSLTYR